MDRFVSIPNDVKRYARKKRFIRYGIRILIFLALMYFAVWQVFIVGDETFERVKPLGRIMVFAVDVLILLRALQSLNA